MEWIEGVHGFLCLCFCPLNHSLDVPCSDDRIIHSHEHPICDACANAMGLSWSLNEVKRQLVQVLS